MINRIPESSVSRLRLRKDVVLVELERYTETTTPGGIILPAEAPRPIDGYWATVRGVPPDLKSFRRVCQTCERPYDEYDDAPLEPGMRVLLDSPTAGDAIMVDGSEHRMVRMAEIAAVMEP